MVSRFAGSQLVTAPNHRTPASAWQPMWKYFIQTVRTNPFTPISIEVGPPSATLRALLIEPGDYHCRFETKSTTTNGRGTFSLLIKPATNTFAPLVPLQTVVLLHGYGLSKESMAPWALALAQKGYRVIAIDLRGHGDSTGAQIGFGKYERTDLRQALDTLVARGVCDGSVVAMGISYGATMALQWAAHDARIRSVIAIAPYNQADEAMVRFVEMQRLYVPERVVRRGAAAAAARLELKWEEFSGETAMRRITQPVLLIGSEEDTLSRPADLRLMERMAAGKAKTVLVPDGPHQVIGFTLDKLLPEITRWLASVDKRG